MLAGWQSPPHQHPNTYERKNIRYEKHHEPAPSAKDAPLPQIGENGHAVIAVAVRGRGAASAVCSGWFRSERERLDFHRCRPTGWQDSSRWHFYHALAQ